LRRGGEFLLALGRPDLTPAFLSRVLGLGITTLAMALLGTILAILGGLVLGVLASRNVLVADARGARGFVRRTACGAARLLQDVLRGVPDFAWAIMAIPLLGLGPAAGVAALVLNVSGILGRIYSELFDSVPPRLLEPLRACGAGRLQTFLYGILPTTRSGVLSLALFRWECAVRNAAVVGVVGGGGLGSEIALRLAYGEYPKLVTLLGVLVLLTLVSDLLSRVVRGPLGGGAEGADAFGRARRRGAFLVGTLGALGVAAAVRVGASLSLRGLLPASRMLSGVLSPDLSPARVLRALGSAGLPLSMAFLGTLLAAAGAAFAAYLSSSRFQLHEESFTGRRAKRRLRRVLVVASVRGLAVLSRGVPDVFWAMLLVSVFRLGPLPGMLALALHSFGLLARIFAESIDGLPPRPLEVLYGTSGSRIKTYLYGAVPGVLPEWIANTFFQFEANVRAAVVLGIVGVGGLGFLFSFEFEFFHFSRAGTYLLVMVALATVLDRLSRRLGLVLAHVEV
jgi:phosphonate transport system permease protein